MEIRRKHLSNRKYGIGAIVISDTLEHEFSGLIGKILRREGQGYLVRIQNGEKIYFREYELKNYGCKYNKKHKE